MTFIHFGTLVDNHVPFLTVNDTGTVGDGTVVGMGSILMNRSTVGEGSMVGAGTLITEDKTIEPRSVVLGRPGKRVKAVNTPTAAINAASADSYVEEAALYLSSGISSKL